MICLLRGFEKNEITYIYFIPFTPLFTVKVSLKIQRFTSLKIIIKRLHPGSLFVCIKGYTVDGHDFAEDAVGKGAVAVLAEKELSLKCQWLL